MKKLFAVMMSVALIFAVTACGSAGDRTEESSSSGQNAPERTAAEAKGLVVYFSWSGNTENVANSIKDQTGSDIFEIVPQTSYSDDYDTVVDLAREEQRTDARPEISGSIDNIAQYDVIYVGYPNWLAYHKLIQCTQLA